MPERLHTDRKLIGTKQVLKALKAGRVAAGVEVIPVATMKELGKLCQIHVGAACAALLR